MLQDHDPLIPCQLFFLPLVKKAIILLWKPCSWRFFYSEECDICKLHCMSKNGNGNGNGIYMPHFLFAYSNVVYITSVQG